MNPLASPKCRHTSGALSEVTGLDDSSPVSSIIPQLQTFLTLQYCISSLQNWFPPNALRKSSEHEPQIPFRRRHSLSQDMTSLTFAAKLAAEIRPGNAGPQRLRLILTAKLGSPPISCKAAPRDRKCELIDLLSTILWYEGLEHSTPRANTYKFTVTP